MAQTNADGSIVLTTRVDDTGIKKWFESVKNGTNQATEATKKYEKQAKQSGEKVKLSFDDIGKSIQKVASYLGIAFGIRAFVQFSNASADMATQTEASVQRLVDIYGEASGAVGDFIDQNARALGLSKSAAASFSSVYGNLFSVWADQETNAELTNRYLQATAVVASKTGRTVEDVQERIRSGLLGNTEAIEDLGIFVNVKTIEMTDAFQRMAGGKSWEQLDAYTQQQIRSMAILEQATAKYGDQVADTSATIRNKFNAAYQDFQNSWGTIVNQVLLPVLQTLTEIFNIATVGLNAFSGRSGQILEDAEDITDTSADTAENIKEQVDAQKELNKQLKKSLAGFDEIQILSEKSSESAYLDEILGGDGSGGGVFGGGIQSPVEEVEDQLLYLMGVIGIALAAVGILLLFFGHIGPGIGFIIGGASTLGITMMAANELNINGVIQMLTTIMGIAGGALLALGIILLWIGGVVGIGVAIGMIIAGGALIVSAVAAQAALSPDDIAAWLSLIMGIAGGALLAIGIILCVVGSIPMGVGMIIAGAASLVSAVALNFNAIWEAITGTFNAIIDWIKTYGLLVLGILLCLTGSGIPFGIALIIKWAKEGAENGVPLATAIVDKVKEIWDAVKEFWNTNIAPIFTAQWWLNLGNTCINGLIAGFEGGINGIITAFESMINWIVDGLNNIGFDIPDWLGGGHFGINIPNVNFGRVSIPRLAQGTVLPGGKPFAAIVNDQPAGQTNIEAPLSTIEQAVENVLNRQGNNIVKEEHYYLNENEIMRIIYRLAKQGEKAQGGDLIESW